MYFWPLLLIMQGAAAFLLAQSYSRRSLLILSSKLSMEDSVLKERILQYMEKRNTTEPLYTDLNKTESAFAFLQPSGWYKDKAELDFKKRIDPTIRKEEFRHPLAYVDLKRFGFDDLIEPIMERGGPYEVGESLMNFNWEEAKEIWDEALRPTREESWVEAPRGALLLGGALEDKLAAAASLDLEQLKAAAVTKEAARSAAARESGEGEDYTAADRKKTKKFKYERRATDEDRFSLSLPQRLYLLLVSASFALSSGRSSTDLVARNSALRPAVETAGVVFQASALANVASGAFCAAEARKKQRSGVVWALQGALGGPLAIQQVRQARDKSGQQGQQN